MLWLVVNKPLEGPLLLGLGDGHGVTLGDVLSVVAVLAAALAALRRRLEHRAAQGDAEPVRAGRGTTRTGR